MDICSLKAYDEIVENGTLGRMQKIVLDIFIRNFPSSYTATEIVTKLGRGTSENIRNRITELEQLGFLKKIKKVYCPIAQQKGKKRLVNLYQWTKRTSPSNKIMKTIICPCCKGVGTINKMVCDGNL